MKTKDIFFIAEQDGEVEKEFKTTIIDMLSGQVKKIRAYLVKVSYEEQSNEFNVAICFKTVDDYDQELLDKTIKIFKSMFGSSEHLDIIFLEDVQEIKIRDICCPFFVSEKYQFPLPDFYLTSSEGYDLKAPRACFKIKKVLGENPDGYLLCKIYPEITGQKYGLGEKNINQILLVSRHENYTLFPIKEWPAYVHVARPIVDKIEGVDYIDRSIVELIGWGEIYKNKDDIAG